MLDVKNVMEELVNNEIDFVIKNTACCSCPKCKNDIAAMALNKLKPKYCSSEKGEVFSKLDKLSRHAVVEVVSAIAQAAEQVRTQPHHEP